MSKPVLSLEAFADWCEKQGDREYEYTDPDDCAITQYLRFLGFENVSVVMNFYIMNGEFRELPENFSGHAIRKPRTFSALAARLRSAS